MGFLTQDDFGKVGDVLSTLALIVILYEGGLNLRARDLLTSSLPAMMLSATWLFNYRTSRVYCRLCNCS